MAANQYGNITQRFCGENRYIGVRNILEFYITPECTIVIRPRNAIQTMVRMEFTMEEFFYVGGGPTRFVDRLCGVLGIHSSEVKIVSVYEGSVIVNYELTVEDDSQEALEDLQKLQEEAFENGTFDFGAPILDWASTVSMAGDDDSVSDQAYVPVLVIDQKTGEQYYQNDPNVFSPDLEIVSEVNTVYINKTVFDDIEPEVV